MTELAPAPMRPQVRDRLATLMRMELVRPDQASFAGEEAYRFRHLLIRDAAYLALAKATRSELHERFAGWLEQAAADRLGEYQEIIAYHLEQAYLYRVELGPPDAHARELAQRAGRLLGEAALRANARLDISATADLLERVIALVPREVRNVASSLAASVPSSCRPAAARGHKRSSRRRWPTPWRPGTTGPLPGRSWGC